VRPSIVLTWLCCLTYLATVAWSKEIMFHFCWLVCLLTTWQDYSKSSRYIFMKLGGLGMVPNESIAFWDSSGSGLGLNFLLFNVRQSYCARYWYRLNVCPSVYLSVTRWYCVETAQPIIKLSSLPGSPMILVYCSDQTFSRNSNGNTPTRALNAWG